MQQVNTFGKNKIFFRTVFIIFAVFIMGLIFYFSSQNATRSVKTSSDLILKLTNIFVFDFENKSLEQQKIIIDSLQFLVRKSAHFLIFCSLGFSFCGFFSTFNFKKSLCFAFSLSCSAIYAASDEFHQMFVSGRSAEFRDVLIDSSGAALGALIMLLVLKIISCVKFRFKEGC